ncbi:MAG: right-handed parallel beta-helix repeat-containing protein [Deltaproteobacteria bacterium]|nr:right-handed parallel beta-helix repeat-containing protein [Deltaproteobacteria bacterium]
MLRWRLTVAMAVTLLGVGCGGGGGGERDGGPDGGAPADAELFRGDSAICWPLPAPTGTVVTVTPSQAAMLPSIVARASADSTIVLMPGTYPVGRLAFQSNSVTLRSANDDAASVILDGTYTTPELINISTSDITIAHITLRRAVDHLIHVSPLDGGADVRNLRIYGVTFEDAGEQFLKVNPNAARTATASIGRVECSHFRMTAAGRPHVERTPGGCYTGGIDAHGTSSWTVERNRFEGIYCAGEGLAEHAIHFWVGGSDNQIQQNVIINCARGIGVGLGEGTGQVLRTQVRNNGIWADVPYFDTGIGVEDAPGTKVFNNTVVSADGLASFFASIDLRFAGTDAEVRNNLVRSIRVRDGATPTLISNHENTPLGWLVSPATGDFHLTAAATGAIDQGTPGDTGFDLDQQLHNAGAGQDIGADEYQP